MRQEFKTVNETVLKWKKRYKQNKNREQNEAQLFPIK